MTELDERNRRADEEYRRAENERVRLAGIAQKERIDEILAALVDKLHPPTT